MISTSHVLSHLILMRSIWRSRYCYLIEQMRKLKVIKATKRSVNLHSNPSLALNCYPILPPFGTFFAVFLSFLAIVLSDIGASENILASQFLMLSMPVVFSTSFLALQLWQYLLPDYQGRIISPEMLKPYLPYFPINVYPFKNFIIFSLLNCGLAEYFRFLFLIFSSSLSTFPGFIFFPF